MNSSDCFDKQAEVHVHKYMDMCTDSGILNR